jgi:uncharacterized protein DUF6814
MKKLKRFLGIAWILIRVASIVLLVYSAFINIHTSKEDIGKPIPWIIIIAVFTPIAFGLMIFGWYAFTGEYNEDSAIAEDLGDPGS